MLVVHDGAEEKKKKDDADGGRSLRDRRAGSKLLQVRLRYRQVQWIDGWASGLFPSEPLSISHEHHQPSITISSVSEMRICHFPMEFMS